MLSFLVVVVVQIIYTPSENKIKKLELRMRKRRKKIIKKSTIPKVIFIVYIFVNITKEFLTYCDFNRKGPIPPTNLDRFVTT